MYAVPEDCVITYDSNFLQEHIDSSDFEEPRSPPVDTRKGNHNLVKPKKKKMSRKYHPHQYETNREFNQTSTTHLYIDCDEYPVKLKAENKPIDPKETKDKHNKKREKKSRTKNKELAQMNRGDQIAPVKSKLSVFRHKVIPCISSIFKRHCCTNPNMSIIEESQEEKKNCDNRSTYCNNCEQRHVMRVYRKQQNYVVQPVYAIEGNAHKATTGPFAPTKVIEPPLRHHSRKTKNQCSNYGNMSSSSESETQCVQDRQQKVDMFRKRLKDEIMNEHMKYQQNHPIRTQQVQYPSKDNKFHVFSTPLQSRTQAQGIYDPCVDKFPSSSSSFWEYLYDKTNACSRKYQTHRAVVAQCDCTSNAQHNMSSGRSTCCIKQPQPAGMGVPSYGELDGSGREKNTCTCTCKKGLQQQTPPIAKKRSYDPLYQSPSPPGLYNPKPSYENTTDKISNASDSRKKKTKVKCQCPDKKRPPDIRGLQSDPKNSLARYPASQRQQGTQELTNTTGGNQGTTAVKPCQEGHDEIVSSLAQKYNGEVLCIHNPPCILINGCLNLPPQKDQKQQNNDMTFWPVTEDRNSNLYHQTNKVNREQSCQYHVEIDKATDYRVEKKMQSICHHSPPCEVVRGCQRAKYDPQLQNSCVHVPMCKQMPECVVTDRRKTSCNHRPKCRDIPICSRDFVILTARETIGTQVKTSVLSTEKESFICRHEPPCIMIPKCIGRAMCDSSYVNVDAIPGCVHQPSCELIPACCRKSAKEMVSVSSQYPNSCRIV